MTDHERVERAMSTVRHHRLPRWAADALAAAGGAALVVLALSLVGFVVYLAATL